MAIVFLLSVFMFNGGSSSYIFKSIQSNAYFMFLLHLLCLDHVGCKHHSIVVLDPFEDLHLSVRWVYWGAWRFSNALTNQWLFLTTSMLCQLSSLPYLYWYTSYGGPSYRLRLFYAVSQLHSIPLVFCFLKSSSTS